jgi:hypothetical protein
MKCPYCNSVDVVEVAGKMWCQDCERSFDPSTGCTAPAGGPAPAPAASAPLLIKCPACAREVSSQAMSCPWCGQPLRSAAISAAVIKKLKTILVWFVIFIIAGVIVKWLAAIVLDTYVNW